MAHKAPGKHFRKGITLAQLFRMFPDDATAEEWFINARWPEGVKCAHCGSPKVKDNAKHPTMRFGATHARSSFPPRPTR